MGSKKEKKGEKRRKIKIIPHFWLLRGSRRVSIARVEWQLMMSMSLSCFWESGGEGYSLTRWLATRDSLTCIGIRWTASWTVMRHLMILRNMTNMTNMTALAWVMSRMKCMWFRNFVYTNIVWQKGSIGNNLSPLTVHILSTTYLPSTYWSCYSPTLTYLLVLWHLALYRLVFLRSNANANAPRPIQNSMGLHVVQAQ